MAEVKVTLDPQALAKFVRDGGGPAMRYAIELGEDVKDLAKQKVGVSEGSGPHLRDAIVKRVTVDSGGPVVLIGVFNEPKSTLALFHHEGTAPHEIRGNPLLVFYWPKAGRVVFLPKVNHPGTKANPFLVEALEEVMRRAR